MGFLLWTTIHVWLLLLVISSKDVVAAAAAAAASKSSSSSSTITTTMPMPSSPQFRYQSTDFVALIHFNMATFGHNGDPGCDASNWNVVADYAAGKTSDPKTFYPKYLNTTQWFEQGIVPLGANIAVLTAKHGCGFLLWPTRAKFQDGSDYGYNVQSNHNHNHNHKNFNVLQQFVDSAQQFGVGHGAYYSIMKSFYMCRSFYGINSCNDVVLENQRNVSNEEYDYVVLQHVKELWSNYGNYTRIMTDSKLPLQFGNLMAKLQPTAAGTPAHPVDWCGTESGHPSHDVGGGPVWNTGFGYHGQSPVDNDNHNDKKKKKKNASTPPSPPPPSQQWVPKFCDPQLFSTHTWFWEPNHTVKTLEELIPIYHDICGRGMVMEIAFSINRDGLLDQSHATRYQQLGNWVRNCYGTPLASTENQQGTEFILTLQGGHAATDDAAAAAADDDDDIIVFDRILLQEDIMWGERIFNYTITMTSSSTSTTTMSGQDKKKNIEEEVVLVNGDAIGRKRIHLFPARQIEPGTTLQLKLHVTHHADSVMPQLKSFGVYRPCPTGDNGNLGHLGHLCHDVRID